MKIKRLMLAVSFAFATSLTLPVIAGEAENLSGFDFNYSVDLNKSIGLTQVFDDGDRTYFQFTQAENLPTLYTVQNGKNQKVNYEVRPPYIIANGVAKKYALSANSGKAAIYVSYNGKRNEVADEVKDTSTTAAIAKPSKLVSGSEVEKVQTIKKAPNKVVESAGLDADESKRTKAKEMITGSLLNVPFFENSIAISKKAKGDLTNSALKITSAGRIVVRGRPSVDGDSSIANTRALVIKNFLMDLGVEEGTVEVAIEETAKNGKNQGFYLSEVILLSDSKSGIAAGNKTKKPTVAKLPVLDIKSGDLISAQLSTWAKRYNYSLQWDAPEYRATAPLTLNSPFNETLDSVITAMKNNGVLLDVTTYENNVVRVVEAKQ